MGIVLSPATEDKRGSDCTGTDGTANRTLTLTNTAATVSGSENIIVNGTSLHNPDYNMTHVAGGSVITFLNPIWDSDYMKVMYME